MDLCAHVCSFLNELAGGRGGVCAVVMHSNSKVLYSFCSRCFGRSRMLSGAGRVRRCYSDQFFVYPSPSELEGPFLVCGPNGGGRGFTLGSAKPVQVYCNCTVDQIFILENWGDNEIREIWRG